MTVCLLKLKTVSYICRIYEPLLIAEEFNGSRVVNDFKEFNDLADIVIVNRMDEKVKELDDEIYTRDLFSRD